MRKYVSLLIMMMAFMTLSAQPEFIRIINGQFQKNDKNYYYVGTNFWYGPILASTGQGGNRERLAEELDNLKALGIDNLRVLAGADAGSANANSVQPYLQPRPGELNDTLLVGLDYFLVELAKRNMVAVIYLNNSWDWSGGYGFYLKNNGYGDSPSALDEGYNDYVKYAAQFVKSDPAKEMFYNYVKKIVSRTNSITGKPYKDDPAIMAWQIGNEPRSFSKEGKAQFAEYMHKTAAIIKEIDSNHLLSAGSEGSVGCESDLGLYEQIHNDPLYDYLTIHIWPQNWGWCKPSSMFEDLTNVYKNSKEYIDSHLRLANKMNKPIVIEEFGYPRDMLSYEPGSSTQCRDAFYGYILSQVVASSRSNGLLAGCNFWGWAGQGRWKQERWKAGDDYLCDPPHEPQGWYSVFDCDSTTVDLIVRQISKIRISE